MRSTIRDTLDVADAAYPRRRFLATSLSALTLAGLRPTPLLASAPLEAAAHASALRLISQPGRIFRTSLSGNEAVDSWACWVIVQADDDAAIEATGLTVELFNGTARVKSASYTAAGVRALAIKPPLTPRLPDGSLPARPIFWPLAIRIRQTEASPLAIDSMRVVLDLRSGKRTAQQVDVTLPIETYRQKSELLFPFRGKGIILQAGVTNGGHRNRSGQFALDAFGVDDSWSIIAAGDGKQNTDYRGWGREVLAPADGVIVRARSDRPDQPLPETSDPRYYAPEYPNGGDVGNIVTIDHGNGEFSMLAHFKAGSLRVKVGDRVRRGQPLGALGNSGDTSGPHVHYQLQTGPDWEYADALPVKFTNVDQQSLVRGTYFDAE
ncbi:MAG: M23 family metallopeptidase [Luteimonas sp.]|nr:M23 family metallopeptidase [Luteimonas sp.]